MEVREALEEYLATIHQSIRPKTLSEKQRMIGYFCDFCTAQNITLEDVKPKVIATYLDHLNATHHGKKGGPFSTHTTFLHVATLKIFLNWCSQDEELEECVKPQMVHRIPNPRRDVLIKDIFTKEHVLRLLDACNSSDRGSERINAYLHARDRVIVLLLLDTGIRAGELCSLKMNQVFLNKEDPYIRIYGSKTRSWREVGIGEKTRKELTQFINTYRKKGKGTDAFLIRSWRDEPIGAETLAAIIERLGRVAKIKDVRCSPHTFRHSFATFFVRAGGDVFRLSRLLGHSSVRMTETYLRSFTQQDSRRGAPSPVGEIF
jgi:site-specific recombinase XerD